MEVAGIAAADKDEDTTVSDSTSTTSSSSFFTPTAGVEVENAVDGVLFVFMVVDAGEYYSGVNVFVRCVVLLR